MIAIPNPVSGTGSATMRSRPRRSSLRSAPKRLAAASRKFPDCERISMAANRSGWSSDFQIKAPTFSPGFEKKIVRTAGDQLEAGFEWRSGASIGRAPADDPGYPVDRSRSPRSLSSSSTGVPPARRRHAGARPSSAMTVDSIRLEISLRQGPDQPCRKALPPRARASVGLT